MNGLVRVKTVGPLQAVSGEEVGLLLGDDSQSKLKRLATELEHYATKLEAVGDIVDDNHAGQVNNMLSLSKIAWDAMEAVRVDKTKPLLEEQRAINGLFKPAQEAFERIRTITKKRLGDHILRKQLENARKQEEARKAKEEAHRRQQEALEAARAATDTAEQQKADELLDQAGQALIQAQRQVSSVVDVKGVESDWGISTMRFRPVVKSIDWEHVPKDYLEQACRADDCKLRALAIAEYRRGTEIPGIVVVEEPDVVNRPGFR